jgi:hypothetical protein
MRLSVEATCLAWIGVDLETGTISAVRVHAAPENLVIPADPDVISDDPDEEGLVDHKARERAIAIAREGHPPELFDLLT